jgi:peptide/nickel transport system ATP-binding protein/oligopeptide transport system ATP-binding protein
MTTSTTVVPGNRLLLSVQNLKKDFRVRTGLGRSAALSAVDAVSFEVEAGSTVGIVGESGCGKSTTARLILGLIPPDEGYLAFDGHNLRHLRGPQKKAVRREMQMVFQNPYSALNPRQSIGESIGFPMKVDGMARGRRRDRTAELLVKVGLRHNHASYYPHQLSGGQRQRVNIARALALNPRLVICDEAVSALDKSVQAQVLNLLTDLQAEFGLTYLFISHDLNVVQYMASRVLVMYLGQVVEECGSDELYARPLHPYTQALLAAVPDVVPGSLAEHAAMPGEIPSPLNPPSGCRFRTRCPFAMEQCKQERPTMRQVEGGHFVACHLYEPGAPAQTRAPAQTMEVA